MKVIDRLDKYIDYKGLNDNQVTISCGLSQGLLAKARIGKSDLGKKSINKILNIYQDINQAWLLIGEGEMIKSDSSSINADSNIDIEGEHVYRNQGNGFAVDILNNISQLVQTNDRNSISIAKLVDNSQCTSRTIERLVSMLSNNGVEIPENLIEKGGLPKSKDASSHPSQKNRNEKTG